MNAVTHFYRSQKAATRVINYCYTDPPWRLLLEDVYYFFVYCRALPRTVLPLAPADDPAHALDECYPSAANLRCLSIHLVLTVLQLLFLVGLVLTPFLPVWLAALLVGGALLLNRLLCGLLNGSGITFRSDERYATAKPEHGHEQWIYLNGVAAGEHWMKSNLNQLAVTFGRPILGIHNRTSGLIFDIVECLVQRNFSYATNDVRVCYKIMRDVLYDPSKSKVVFILHSQGGIEGGLVLDWLLQEMPQDLLAKLEVYTFGNAANHFNNPSRHAAAAKTANDGAIGHIEHYANATDFVAMWGVLHFATNKMSSPELPRFMGRLFCRSSGRGGHLLNQHYLDGMFPLARDGKGEWVGAAEENAFMEEMIWGGGEEAAMDRTREPFGITYRGTTGVEGDEQGRAVMVVDGDGKTVSPGGNRAEDGLKEYRVKDVSRLWQYRNGRSPSDGVRAGGGGLS